MKTIKDKFQVLARQEYIYWLYSKFKFNIQRYIDDTFEADEIIENLWLGSIKSACNREALEERKIETIVSAVLGASAIFPFDFKYERAKLRDIENEDILSEIQRLVPIIHEDLEKGKGVLCHCFCGVSRSATLVAAYLIKYKNMSVKEALNFIKSKRKQVDPNEGYIKQLNEYSKLCKNV